MIRHVTESRHSRPEADASPPCLLLPHLNFRQGFPGAPYLVAAIGSELTDQRALQAEERRRGSSLARWSNFRERCLRCR
ncbi:hypothetical protein E2C01_041126 [Portunus trituberculatus]|uniref:Uncharacterized protein n=1 Tax=Portunus trituberculatus TaxID=210409 RepID=A0A5B7FLL8_PORTR|nr:hypothetical protein [Portunus trituberculatus]